MKNISELVIPRMVSMARFIGIALVILGLIAFFAPKFTGMTIGVVIGIILVISGILRVVFAWVALLWGDAILRFLFGVLAIVAGGYMIFDPELGLRVITIVAMAYLIADGVSTILFAIRLPPASGSGWILLSGALSIVLGVLIWREWPFPAEQAVGILVGVKLVVDGVAMLAVASTVRAVSKAVS